jgi:hypothetical protein
MAGYDKVVHRNWLNQSEASEARLRPTGAGIGRAAALAFAREGASVVLAEVSFQLTIESLD